MTIDGYAYIPNASEPGQLMLHIDSVPVDGPYWILEVGPINSSTKLYEWAVVSDPTMLSLFILARDAETFSEKYESDVLALVKSLGFTGALNSPVKLYQGSDCKYENGSKK